MVSCTLEGEELFRVKTLQTMQCKQVQRCVYHIVDASAPFSFFRYSWGNEGEVRQEER